MSEHRQRSNKNKNANNGSNHLATSISSTVTTINDGQQTSSAAAIIGWRSQSAPPRKKWYRRGASLLSRQRSTHQSADVPACSMLYDQMVSRRLVGAIAAWHDLHASLLQLSLSRQAEQHEEYRKRPSNCKPKEDGISSDSNSSDSPMPNRVKRLSSKSGNNAKRAAARRPSQPLKKSGPGSNKKHNGAKNENTCRLHGGSFNEQANMNDNKEGQIPIKNSSRDSSLIKSAEVMGRSHHSESDKILINATETSSRSSSLISASSSAFVDDQHNMDRPEIDEDLLSPVQNATSSSWHQGEGNCTKRLGLATAVANFRRAKIGSQFGSEKSSATVDVPATATWSATFAQSLKVRSTSTRRRARSPIPRARSPAMTTRQIVIRHSFKLHQQPNIEQSQSPPEEDDGHKEQQKSMKFAKSPPALLNLARRSASSAAANSTSKGALFRQGGRCFSVAKVLEEKPRRNELEEECNCWSEGRGEGNGGEVEENEDEYESMDEVDEEEEWNQESGASSDLISDSELDSLYEQERNRPKLSMSSPELTPDQLKQLFPELSDHWRKDDDNIGIHFGIANCSIGAEPNCSKEITVNGGASIQKRKEEKNTVENIASGKIIQVFGKERDHSTINANQPELEINENESQFSSIERNIRIPQNFENYSSGNTLVGFQQHSPATSPGASRARKQRPREDSRGRLPGKISREISLIFKGKMRSFHFHLSTSTLANLRKSGVNLVKNIPGNIRRSSLAMFQMRAMGTVDSTKGGGDVDLPSASVGIDRQRHRPSADSSCELQSSETLSLHRQQLAQWAAKSSSSNNSCSSAGGVGNAGAIAKRAMRKRISAAKTVLRKISRISTQSASGCSSIANVGTSSSAGIYAQIGSFSNDHCSAKRSSVSVPSCSIPNCQANCSPLIHSSECRKCSNSHQLLEVDCGLGKGVEERRKWQPEEPKKKRSWAATFVKNKKGRKAKAFEGDDDGEEAEANAIARFGSGGGSKKPLGPSLSWDPQQQQWRQQRSRNSSGASQTSRSRIHSDGSAKQRFPFRDRNNGYWPSAFFSLNAQKCSSQSFSIGEQAAAGREKDSHQFEKHSKKGGFVSAGKRRKKSSSALALCKGHGARGSKKSGSIGTLSQSQSLSTLGGVEFGPDQQKELGKSALESSCLHCALLAEYRTTNLRAEIECAVKRLAARLTNSGSPARARRTIALGEQKKEKKIATQKQMEEVSEQRQMMELLRKQMGTPDIVVSSCNSEDTPESADDEGFWTNPSPSHTNNSVGHRSQLLNSTTIPIVPSPIVLSPSSNTFDEQNMAQDSTVSPSSISALKSQPTMDTLKPPGFPYGPPSTTSSSLSPSSLCSPLTAPLDLFGSGGLSPPRSNSVDLSQLRRDIELWSVSSLSDAEGCSAQNAEGRPMTAGISTPGGDSIRTVRSRSYDPSSSPDILRRPSRIEHLSEIFRKALAKSPVVKRAAAAQEQEHKRVPKHRTSRYWLEEQLTPSEHIWLTSSSISSSSATTVDTECYLGEKDCEKLGEKRRCSACHIVAHTACFPLLAKMNLSCKYTFRDCASTSSSSRRQNAASSKNGNGDALQKHHWVHRWRLEGRCFHCGKSFQQKMFREKEVIAITCSWCKRSYHNKRSCFSLARFDDHCDRGLLRELILPPGWLLRLGNQRRHRHQQHAQQAVGQILKKSKRKYRPFVVKQMEQSVPNQQHNGLPSEAGPFAHQIVQPNGRLPSCCTPSIQPLLVFVNPKSGGNKGAKALNSLCWLLNPRQVFDINALRGPKFGLEMYRKVASQMRILVCGGDGTVGWVLSTLDSLNWSLYPPIALLPLGTGNDLSRTMGWGGTFSDEPLTEMLQAIQTETSVTHLDRWRLDVFPLPTTEISNPSGSQTQQTGNNETAGSTGSGQEEQQPSTPICLGSNSTADSFQTSLPLSVMNNYFSIGADAHVALQFHHSRSANPQMLNSRLKNRIAYGGLGTIDLFKRTWKDLTEFITVECDGVDITPKLREMKFHCILFHNIAFYAGGTVPWGAGGDGVQENCGEVFSRPSPCDGKIEVLGFTTATLATLQMGGKGERIAQCSKVRIETLKPIPMQVDGEPTLLGPSLILLSFHNKVPMLRREKYARMSGSAPANNIVSMNANRRKSSNNSSSGGGNQNVVTVGNTATTNSGQISPMMTMQTSPPQHHHKCSKASLCANSILQRPVASSPPNSVFLCVPIVVVGRHDYDTYRDSVDRLKDTGFELGTLNVEAEMELGQIRQQIQQMLVHHQILPYEPGRDWRFLDYVSNSEEGAFRISRQQEQCRTVADVCTLDEGGILILDDSFPSMTVRSAAIGHELVFCPPGSGKPMSALEQNLLMRRRISETLRIVLSSESQETHL